MRPCPAVTTHPRSELPNVGHGWPLRPQFTSPTAYPVLFLRDSHGPAAAFGKQKLPLYAVSAVEGGTMSKTLSEIKAEV